LPLNSDAKKTITETSDQAIVRDPSHRFGQGLRHKKAVKGILVVCGEPFDRSSMFGFYRKQAVSRLAKIFQRKLSRHRHVTSSQAVFDADFPYRHSTDPDRVFWREDQFASFCRQAGMIGNSLLCDMGVEQKLQDPILCRNSRATSSLFASISSGTSKAPLARQCAALAVAPRAEAGALLVVRSGQ